MRCEYGPDVGEANPDPATVRGGDAAHVVPPEVNQHHVLGDLSLLVRAAAS